MERQTVFQTGVVLTLLVAGGSAAVITTSMPASPQVQADLQAPDTISAESPDGNVTHVVMWGTGTASWTGIEDTGQISVSMAVQNPDGSWENIGYMSPAYDEEEDDSVPVYEDGLNGGHVIGNTNWTASDFTEPEDGETKRTDLEVRYTLYVDTDDDGTLSDREFADVTVEVTNTEDETAAETDTADAESTGSSTEASTEMDMAIDGRVYLETDENPGEGPCVDKAC